MTPESVYSDDYIDDLESFQPINNIDILEPFELYLRDDLNLQHNLVLKKGYKVDVDFILVPMELAKYFIE